MTGNGAADNAANGIVDGPPSNGGNGASLISGLRGALAAAIKGRNDTIAELRAAQDALRRGREIEAAAAVDLHTFDDLDQRIADARARRIADHARQGDGELPVDWFDIGPALEEAKRLRGLAQDRLAAATQARAALDRDAAAAREVYDAAAARVAHAAAAVVTAEASEMANDLIHAKERLWQLEDRLQGLTRLGSSAARPMSRLPLIADALALQRERYLADRLPGLPAPVEHESMLWQEYMSRLAIDAAAEWAWRPPSRRPVLPIGQIPGFVPPSLADARRRARLGDEKALAALERVGDPELPAIRAELEAKAAAAAADPAARPPIDSAFAEMLAHRARGG
jgi:hypothetical protein